MVSNSLPEGETHPVVRDGLDGRADELDLVGPRTRNKHCTFICSCFFEIFQKTLVESKPARGMWTSILFLSDRKPLTRKENQFGGLHFLEQPLTRIGAREGTQGFSENSPRDSSRKFSSFYHASQRARLQMPPSTYCVARCQRRIRRPRGYVRTYKQPWASRAHKKGSKSPQPTLRRRPFSSLSARNHK